VPSSNKFFVVNTALNFQIKNSVIVMATIRKTRQQFSMIYRTAYCKVYESPAASLSSPVSESQSSTAHCSHSRGIWTVVSVVRIRKLCSYYSDVIKRIFTNFKNFKNFVNSPIFTNFKHRTHEFFICVYNVQSSIQITATDKPTLGFYRPDSLPCHQTNSAKHRRQKLLGKK